MLNNFIVPKFENIPSIKMLQTTRLGGFSSGVYSTFNLSFNNDDNIDKDILEFKPDSIISISQDYFNDYRNLCEKPIYIRNKWINTRTSLGVCHTRFC